jgi:excisionase family DNA binding protein
MKTKEFMQNEYGEAAKILRVNPATLYRAIREDAFPAVRVRTRYVVPSAALDRLIAEVAESGVCGCGEVGHRAADGAGRRAARGASW